MFFALTEKTLDIFPDSSVLLRKTPFLSVYNIFDFNIIMPVVSALFYGVKDICNVK